MNKVTLALVFLTNERENEFEQNIREVIREAAPLNIPIYVSDESSEDRVGQVVYNHKKIYDNIHYCKNISKLGRDENFLRSLVWPDADYVWVLEHCSRPQEGHLEMILKVLNGQDLVFVNSHSSNLDHGLHLELNAARKFLLQNIWHQASVGTTIYGRRIIEWVKTNPHIVRRNFPHVSIMLGFAEKLHFSLLWLSDFRIISEDSYSPHAYEDVINVFVFDWASMINSFPDLIPKRSRASVIRSHSENTDMFTLSSLRKFRQRRILKLTFLLSRDFWSSMHLKMQDVIASVLIPNFALRSLQETSTGSEAK